MSNQDSNLIVIFLESDDPINLNENGIYCWNKTDSIELEPGTYFYRDVETNFYNTFSAENGSYFVDKPYELGVKQFYKCVDNDKSNYCISCGVDMGENNPRQYCRKTYCPNENN
jgi:hypothetical protein